MKRISTFCILAVLTSVGMVNAGDVIVNGDFEITGGWALRGDAGYATDPLDASNRIGGIWWTNGGFSQRRSVGAGVYEFGADIYLQDNHLINRYGYIQTRWYNDQNVLLDTVDIVLDSDSLSGQWVSYSDEYDNTSGNATEVVMDFFVQVIDAGAFHSGHLRIDNAYVGPQGVLDRAQVVFPSDGAQEDALFGALVWRSITTADHSPALEYDVWFSEEGGSFVKIAEGITDASLDLVLAGITLIAETNYVWRVDSTDTATSVTTESNEWTFFYSGDMPPVADAGSTQILWWSDDDPTPPLPIIQLEGSYWDDGVSPVAVTWTVEFSPVGAAVVIADAGNLTTTVEVDQLGEYGFRLTVEDAYHTVSDVVEVGIYEGLPPSDDPIFYLPLNGSLDNLGDQNPVYEVMYWNGNHGANVYSPGFSDRAMRFVSERANASDNDRILLWAPYSNWRGGTIGMMLYVDQLYNHQGPFDNLGNHENDWETWITGAGVINWRLARWVTVNYNLVTNGLIGEWFHFAVTWQRRMADPTRVDIEMYINGNLVASANSPWTNPGDVFAFGTGLPQNTPFNGKMDEIYVFDRKLSGDEIADLIPNVATSPMPVDGTRLATTSPLGWTAPDGADAPVYDVYFGTDFAFSGADLLGDDISENSYALPTAQMAHDNTYYWRVDTTVDGVTTLGSVWNFVYAEYFLADIDENNRVDLRDFAILARHWEQVDTEPCPGRDIGDLNDDCVVDLADMELFVLDWLQSNE